VVIGALIINTLENNMEKPIVERIISYRTSDGKLFDDSVKALKHQRVLNFVERFGCYYYETEKETIKEFMMENFNELREFFVHENEIAPPR